MDFKPLTLNEKQLFLNYYQHSPTSTCFLSFVNLFMWRNFENVRYTLIDGEPLVSGGGFEGRTVYFMLPQTNAESMKKVMDALFSEYGKEFRLFCLTEAQTKLLEELYPEQFSFSHDRDNDNYCYDTQSLISLSGKKLHAKRNHINKFQSLYQWEYVSLDKETAQECIETAIHWCQQKNCEQDTMLHNEVKGCIEALKNMDALQLKGGAIRIDGNIVAFSLGERLNDDMALIHIEKANPDFAGSYAVINNEFAKRECADTKWINREEDMGLEGLRKAKLSYRPAFLLEMFVAKPL